MSLLTVRLDFFLFTNQISLALLPRAQSKSLRSPGIDSWVP
jgi:hypothetical protein